MTPDQQRRFNTIFGGIFLGTGIIAWMMAVYFAVTPNPPAPAPVTGVPSVDLPSCRSALQQLGYNARLKNNDVTAFEALTDTPRDQLEKASLAQLACKLPLQSFCMGEGCETPGLSFTLRKAVALKHEATPAASASAAPSAPAPTAAPAAASAARPGAPTPPQR